MEIADLKGERMGTETNVCGPTGHAAMDSRDDANLARLGKKPVLKRHFGFMTILGFSCTILITWEGSLMLVLSHLIRLEKALNANFYTVHSWKGLRSKY